MSTLDACLLGYASGDHIPDCFILEAASHVVNSFVILVDGQHDLLYLLISGLMGELCNRLIPASLRWEIEEE